MSPLRSFHPPPFLVPLILPFLWCSYASATAGSDVRKFVPPADAQLWCVFRARFALSKEGFCFKLITVRRIFIKSVISHPMIIRESPHSI